MGIGVGQESIESRPFIGVELRERRRDAGDPYLRAMLNACASGAALLDEAGTILYVNGAWRRLAVRRDLVHDLYGVGLHYVEVCKQVSGASVEEAAAIVEGLRQILLGRETEFQKEYVCRRPPAGRSGLIRAARLDAPGPFRVLVTHDDFPIDVAERRRTEETLVNLSGRLINAQEEERKRIALELHDDLNQRMALLSIELAQLGQRIQKPRSLRQLIRRLQTKSQEISGDIHRLSYRLHPSKLDHLGLAAAVESLCEELSASRRLKVEFRRKGFPAAIPKDIRLCVFRIAQESLRNCIKHSGALKARVVLEKTEGAVRFRVSDDGCGFDTKSDAMKKGLGFTSMRERLRLVGGELRVCSQPLNGTRIEIWVPLTEEAETDQ